MTAPPTPDRIMTLVRGFMASRTVLSAVELGLFGALAEGSQTADELRERLGLHTRAARDFFDALVALGMLRRTDDRYHNTPETAAFLDPARPSYLGGLAEMAGVRSYRFWGSLTEALRTGEPQNESQGGGPDFFQALYADPDRLRQFAAAMSGASLAPAMVVAELFDWSGVGTFCDLGTARGTLPVQVALRHPHLRGVGFDLPPLGPVFSEFVAARGLTDRVRFAGGDFFTDPLPPAEVYVLGRVLHDWGMDAKRRLLERVYRALPAGGSVIVYDMLIDDDRRANAAGLLMSLNMLIETADGFDYTGADCQGWLAEAGFRPGPVQPLLGPDSMLVGVK